MPILPLVLTWTALAVPPAPVTYNGRARELTVKPPRVESTVTVDGHLDEPAWQMAALLTGFSQFSPQDGVASADSTQILVWYSPTAIHFGVRAYQPAGTVRATLADRDKIASDDQIQILLGTFHDRRQATVLMVNPLGVQADGILVERGTLAGGGFSGTLAARESPDLSPDYVFQSKGRLTDFGYEVEVVIPFKSLKYQAADIQAWDLNVVRVVQYRGYEDSWAPALRAGASFLAQGGTLDGIQGLARDLVVDITPEATQRTEGLPSVATPGRWDYNARNPAVGGNVRWGVTSNLTLNATINPDFSQVEADATPVVLDPRAAISFAEKRPFFLENIEQFAVPNNLVYTRRVVQPLAAGKLSGKVAGANLAILSAEDAASASVSKHDHALYNVLRLQQDLGSSSRIGMAYTDKVEGANANRVVDVDGRWVWSTIHSLQYQVAGSTTRTNGVQVNGPLWDLRYARAGKNLVIRSLFNGMGDQFFTQTGFLSRNDQVHANVNPRYTWFAPRGAVFEQYSVDLLFDDIWEYKNWLHSGDARDKKYHFTLQSQLRGGWTASAAIYWETFGYDPGFYGPRYRVEIPHAGAPSDTLPFTGTPRLANRDWVVALATPKWKLASFSVTAIGGQDENFAEWSSANIWYVNFAAEIRPTDQLRIAPTFLLQDYWRRTNLTRVGLQMIPRVKAEYQVNRDLFVRVIGEYASNYSDVLRDDSRTNGYLLVKNSAGKWVRTVKSTTNSVRGDFLFSYRPTPGTVFYAGYDAQMSEPNAFSFGGLNRTNDAFFVKLSYLLRL